MNLEEWLTKYISSSLKNQEQAQRGIAEFREIFFGKKVYFWGAGIAVRHYLDLFENVGVPIEGLIDKKNHGKLVEGYCVLPPSVILTIADPMNTLVITSVGGTFATFQIISDFSRLNVSIPQIINGLNIFFPLQNQVCQCNLLEGRMPQTSLCYGLCKSTESVCSTLIEYTKTKASGDFVFNILSCLLGTLCTLKCEHCAEGIPYIPHDKRTFVPLEIIKKDIKKIMSICDYVIQLRLGGGETFLHPNLKEVIEFILTLPKFELLQVFTNGTVIPDDSLCSVLNSPRIAVAVTNYAKSNLRTESKEKIPKTIQKLKTYGVLVEERNDLFWVDINSFLSRGLSELEMTCAYKSCQFATCHILHNGILYNCPHYYTGVQTGHLTCNPYECVHIHDIPQTELPEAIRQYLNRPFVSACDHCMAPFDAPEVQTGWQLEKEPSS